MDEDARQHVAAVDTAVSILEALEERDAAGVTELARELDRSKSNVHKHLVTLRDHGFVRRTGTNYRLGFRFFTLGSRVRSREPLFTEATASVRELATITSEVATLMVADGEMGVYLCLLGPKQDARTEIDEGTRTPLYRTASGRAVLAGYGADERDRRLPDALDDELAAALSESFSEVGRRGVATAPVGESTDLREIAAPVTVDGEPLGAVGLVADAAFVSEQSDSTYSKLVKKTAQTVSKRMRIRYGSE